MIELEHLGLVELQIVRDKEGCAVKSTEHRVAGREIIIQFQEWKDGRLVLEGETEASVFCPRQLSHSQKITAELLILQSSVLID